jgi:uncharacterized membrane protein YdjX (TVP38/TMEM64 family)
MIGRIAAVLALLATLAFGVLAIRLWPDEILHATEAVIAAIHAMGPLGWVALALLQLVIATVGLLPASLLAIGAGLVYGVLEGFLIVAGATMLAAVISFAVSRSLFRPMILRAMARRPRVAAFDALMARDGWRSVCLIRLSPIMPFAATSLVLGLSSITLADFLVGTTASLPALLGYVLLGSLSEAGLAALRSGGGWMQWTLLGIGILATLWATLRLGSMVARAMRVG